MKSVVAPYATSAWCVRIECTNGTIVRLTSYPHDLIMSNASVYKTDHGYEPTAFSSTSSMSPSSIDLEGIVAVGGVSHDALASGVFDNARVYVFKCNFLSPVEDYEEITAGFFGKTTITDDHYRIEGMSLIDALNQSVGKTYTAACSNALGDAGCGISIALIEKTGSLTGITSRLIMRDSARTEDADWFGAGTIRFTSGSNAGLGSIEIRSYAADGTITLFDPLYYMPEIGDAYVLVPGCRKRLEDCRDKWANVAVTGSVHALKIHPNKGGFSGFPYIPVSSSYQQVGGNR